MFETERLILRKLLPTDLNAIFKMRKDPFVMRYIHGPQTDLDSSVKWIEMMTKKWDDEKIGFCGVVLKETGDFIGWCGLWRLVGTEDIEVGYAVDKDHWGNGYATEAAFRCLEYGFSDLGFKKIVAVAYPENKASQEVMKKIGLKYIQTGIFYEKELVQYGISVDDFFENSSSPR